MPETWNWVGSDPDAMTEHNASLTFTETYWVRAAQMRPSTPPDAQAESKTKTYM